LHAWWFASLEIDNSQSTIFITLYSVDFASDN